MPARHMSYRWRSTHKADGQSSLTTWLDLELPRRHTTVCVCESVSRKLYLRREDPPWIEGAPSHALWEHHPMLCGGTIPWAEWGVPSHALWEHHTMCWGVPSHGLRGIIPCAEGCHVMHWGLGLSKNDIKRKTKTSTLMFFWVDRVSFCQWIFIM